MKKTNVNTEVAALKNTIKQKDEALAELAHDNIELGRKLQVAGGALDEVREKGRVAELALGGVRELREQHAKTRSTLQATEREVQGLRLNNANLSASLRDSEATARWYKFAFRFVVLGNLLTAAVITFKFGL